MNTGVHAFVRSPVALGWTLLGAFAALIIVAAAFRIGAIAARSPVVADPTVIDGLGGFLLAVVFAAVVVALLALVWLPCGLGVAYAVGSRIRGDPAAAGDSIDRLYVRREPLYRWVKTNVAIDPVADRLLSEADVSPAEVAVGCDSFVVPALALDSPTLRSAVDRANRTVPRPGRGRVLLAGVGSAGALVAAALAASLLGSSALPSMWVLLASAAAVGAVFTAALDTAWRTGVYAQQDPDEGFG